MFISFGAFCFSVIVVLILTPIVEAMLDIPIIDKILSVIVGIILDTLGIAFMVIVVLFIKALLQ